MQMSVFGRKKIDKIQKLFTTEIVNVKIGCGAVENNYICLNEKMLMNLFILTIVRDSRSLHHLEEDFYQIFLLRRFK